MPRSHLESIEESVAIYANTSTALFIHDSPRCPQLWSSLKPASDNLSWLEYIDTYNSKQRKATSYKILGMGTLHTKKPYTPALAVLRRKNTAVDVLHEHKFLIFKAWFFHLFVLKWHIPYKNSYNYSWMNYYKMNSKWQYINNNV